MGAQRGTGKDGVHEAIAVTTAWLHDDADRAQSNAAIVRSAGDGALGVPRLLIGFVDLAGALLKVHEEATGRTPTQTLQAISAQLGEHMPAHEQPSARARIRLVDLDDRTDQSQ